MLLFLLYFLLLFFYGECKTFQNLKSFENCYTNNIICD